MSSTALNETNTPTPGPHIEVLVSNLSLSPLVATLGSLAMAEREVRAVGADGIELTHLNPKINALTRQILREAYLTEHEQEYHTSTLEAMIGFGLDRERSRKTYDRVRRLVRAQHATFAGERPPLNLLGRILPFQKIFPKRSQSFEYMRRTQIVTGELPAVLYTRYADVSPADIHYSDQEAPFTPTLFQPKKDDWKDMGLTEQSSAVDIKEAMTKRGLTGVALDLFQVLEFDNPDVLVDTLLEAGLIDEVHLSVGRTDLIGIKNWRSAAARRTRTASRAFTLSPEAASETDEGKFLVKILQKWRETPDIKRRIVVEKGPWDFINRRRKLGRMILNTRGLINSNAQPVADAA